MSNFVQVQWTAAHLDEAREISQQLVLKSLAASVSISPLLESWYIWDDELVSTSEVLVTMRSHEDLFEQIQSYIVKHHSYDVPEILMFPILQGNDPYLKWIERQIEVKMP